MIHDTQIYHGKLRSIQPEKVASANMQVFQSEIDRAVPASSNIGRQNPSIPSNPTSVEMVRAV